MSFLAKPLAINVLAQGNLSRSHDERLETLPEDIRAIQAGETAGFMRKISPKQCFVTTHDLDDELEEVMEHAENFRYLETMKHLFRWDGFEDTENWPSTASQGRVSLVSLWN